MVKLYFLDIKNFTWSDREEALLRYVSRERADRIARYRHEPEKIRSLYSALMIRKICCELYGIINRDLSFYADENGRPYMKQKDGTTDFSLSHTADAVLCGVTDRGRVGVDVEKLRKAPLKVMKKAFHPDEVSFTVRSAKNRDLRFFECWTRKEAYLKKTGMGLNANLSSINTLARDTANKIYTWREGNYICSFCAGRIPENFSRDFIFHLSGEDLTGFF